MSTTTVMVPASIFSRTKSGWNAVIGRRSRKNKVIEYYIEHPMLKGVTPDMLHWWFKHIDGKAQFEGKVYPKFQLQHPVEHIGLTLLQPGYFEGGGFTKGAILHLREFRGHRYFEELVYCLKNDRKGISLQFYKGHLPSGHLNHTFEPVENGTKVFTTFRIGKNIPIIGHLFNPYLRRKKIDEKLIHQWQYHIVEEFENLQKVIPALYPKQ